MRDDSSPNELVLIFVDDNLAFHSKMLHYLFYLIVLPQNVVLVIPGDYQNSTTKSLMNPGNIQRELLTIRKLI